MQDHVITHGVQPWEPPYEHKNKRKCRPIIISVLYSSTVMPHGYHEVRKCFLGPFESRKFWFSLNIPCYVPAHNFNELLDSYKIAVSFVTTRFMLSTWCGEFSFSLEQIINSTTFHYSQSYRIN